MVSSQIRSGRHCIWDLKVHVVFVTKYRRNVITQDIMEAMKSIFIEICDNSGAKLLEMNGEDDHVHLMIEYPPKLALSKLINNLKGLSSRILRKRFPSIRNKLWKGYFWSRSYYVASCGGVTIEVVKNYIENQRGHSAILEHQRLS
jgi:putative transposase